MNSTNPEDVKVSIVKLTLEFEHLNKNVDKLSSELEALSQSVEKIKESQSSQGVAIAGLTQKLNYVSQMLSQISDLLSAVDRRQGDEVLKTQNNTFQIRIIMGGIISVLTAAIGVLSKPVIEAIGRLLSK